MKKSLPLILLGLTVAGVESVCAQNITSANITNKSAQEKAAAVNVTLNGTLTTTGNGDFRQLRDLCWQMTSLNIANATCPDIPRNALHSRHKLKTLKLPTGVSTIGSQAFFACDALSGTLSIPNNATSIGASAFAMCKALEGVKISTTSKLVNIGSYAFKGCESLTGSVIVPKGIVLLRDGVFEGCVKLEEVKLPDNLQTIGANTFSGCKALTGEINMGRMLTRIGASAFADCVSLESITMPRALQSLGDAAFMNCTGLRGSVKIPGSIQYLGKGAFAGCSGLESVVLPDGLKAVNAATFAGCTSLSSVTLYSAVPPVADATAFAGVNCMAVELFVPQSSLEAYSQAPVWKDFDVKVSTSVTSVKANGAIDVEMEGSRLWVKNLPCNSQAKLFDAQGRLIASVLAEGDASFELDAPGMYIVTAGGRSFKVKY